MTSLLDRLKSLRRRTTDEEPAASAPAAAAPAPAATTVDTMRERWNEQGKANKDYVAFLQQGATWDEAEFHKVGVRFAERMMERFIAYGSVTPSYAHMLEIGCGVGRLLKPLAARFDTVTGVDISEEMLRHAAEYCACMPNIRLILNDGHTLKEIADESMDYVGSAGVFQHIIDFTVIAGYITEALRVLKPGGVFVFQCVGSYKEWEGAGNRGAKITAGRLDSALVGQPYRIRELSADPNNPLHSLVIVLEKVPASTVVPEVERSFRQFPLTEQLWWTGVYDDITTRTRMHEQIAEGRRPLTFYDEQTQA